MTALEHWRSQLAAWAIPEPILAAVRESPWVLPRGVFARRADRQITRRDGPTFEAAWEALAEPGSVLDVGAGAGAASLPLAERVTAVTAVDTNTDLLAELGDRAARLGLAASQVAGRWPDVASDVPPADVVVCSHVLYNVPDLGPFAAALTSHARRRVVVELTERHPLSGLNPLWLRFHDLRRPDGPTADDAVAALREAGIDPQVTRWSRPAETEYETFDELVDVTRRRLCLPPDRATEVAQALRDLGVTPSSPPGPGPDRQLVTLSWDGSAPAE